jgi:hypothetical protein
MPVGRITTSNVFRNRAAEYRTMAELFRSQKTRDTILNAAADYERIADEAAMFELQEADRIGNSQPIKQLSRP